MRASRRPTFRSSPSRSARRSSPASTPRTCVGHLAAWNYFQSVKNPTNEAFIKQWHDFIKNPKRVTNDPMEATTSASRCGRRRCEQAGTTDVDAVRQAMYGQKVKAPSGFVAVMNTNHHLVEAGDDRRDPGQRQFDVVWQTKDAIKADAWSPYLPEDKGKIADWTYPWVCGNCTAPQIRRNRTELLTILRRERVHARRRIAQIAGERGAPGDAT